MKGLFKFCNTSAQQLRGSIKTSSIYKHSKVYFSVQSSGTPPIKLSSRMDSIVKKHRPRQSPELDPSSLSNYFEFSVDHTSLDVKIEFDEKIITGNVQFKLKTINEISKITLDTSFLDVFKVFVNGDSASFEIGERGGPLGSPLSIQHSSSANESLDLKIEFATTDKCTALQFLNREATDGKVAPYLFSQCQAIHARSLFPCFDTPAFKSTYSMKVESPYPSLMSGRPEKSNTENVYIFEQPIPIPSYLVAIASGNIVSLPIGPRSNVYSEPQNISRCQHEFSHDMENFLVTAEDLIFKYEWKNYDALILPASFPYGGMENPNITFATPTLVSGDRANVDVLAHELAHSWSGNLVTNCSWEHFWLNEGWTVYIERRILGNLHGESERHFSMIIGWTDFVNAVDAMGADSEFTKLVVDLKDGVDPDDSFSTVPYEKGSNLLYHIENVVGGTKNFDGFIPYYFTKFRYKSLDTYQFLDTLYEYFHDKKDLLDTIDWNSWLYQPGLPQKPKFDTTLVDQCYKLADRWISAVTDKKSDYGASFSLSDISKFSANQNVVFLDTLVQHNGKNGFSWGSAEGQKAITAISNIYDIYSVSQNAEILFRWFRLLLTGRIESSYSKLSNWLGTVGRMKFVRPGYVLLNTVDHKLAVDTFYKWESGYHPICKAMVKKDLGL